MNGLLRLLRRVGLAIGNVLLGIDSWVERLLVVSAVIAIVILAIVIAWGLIDGRYSIVMPS